MVPEVEAEILFGGKEGETDKHSTWAVWKPCQY